MMESVCVCVLKVKQVSDSEQDDGRGLIADGTGGVCVEAPRGNNWLNVALLFAGGVLYDVAVGGAMEILVIFEVTEPLNWNATQVTLCSVCSRACLFFRCRCVGLVTSHASGRRHTCHVS